MKKIIGVLRPFDKRQNFYVYEDGNKLDAKQPTVDEINETIFALCKEYNIIQIDLTGPKQYNRGLKRKIEFAEMQKYNENKLIINVI